MTLRPLPLLLLACAGGADGERPAETAGHTAETALDTSPDSSPAPWGYEDPGAPVGELAPERLAEALGAALDDARGRDPTGWMRMYLDQLSWATGGCPTFTPARPGESRWEGDCTSDRGARFDGWAVSWWDRDVRGDAGEDCATVLFFFGFLRVTDPSGVAFDAWGTVGETDCTDADGARRIDAYVDGDFAWPLAEGTPWAERRPAAYTWSVEEAGPTRRLVLSGGLEGGDEVVALSFVDLGFDAGAACTLEPEGAVELWDLAGARYRVDFDPAVSCDGCGAASSEGAALGPVCVDVGDWFAWEERPWW